MKKLLIFLFSIITLSAFGQAGSLSQSVYRSRVNDSTTVNGAHASGYGDFYWNNQDTNPGWRVWNGTTYDIGFSSGGNFWNNPGVTTLTGRTAILGSGNSRLHFGMDLSDNIVPLDRFIAHADTMYLGTAVNVIAFEGDNITVTNSVGNTGFTNTAGLWSTTTLNDIDLHSTGGAIHVTTNSVSRLQINNNGSWTLGADGTGTTGEVLTSNGTSPPTWNTNSGTYTPTLTNTANVAASTAYVTGWFRVGTMITVFGKVDIDVTLSASTATELGLSLPVASNMTGEEDLGGTAISDSVASLAARIKGDATNDRASVVFKAISLTNDSYSFEFSYQVK